MRWDLISVRKCCVSDQTCCDKYLASSCVSWWDEFAEISLCKDVATICTFCRGPDAQLPTGWPALSERIHLLPHCRCLGTNMRQLWMANELKHHVRSNWKTFDHGKFTLIYVIYLCTCSRYKYKKKSDRWSPMMIRGCLFPYIFCNSESLSLMFFAFYPWRCYSYFLLNGTYLKAT